MARARVELARESATEDTTCEVWADRYLTRYARDRKTSSTPCLPGDGDPLRAVALDASQTQTGPRRLCRANLN